MVPNDNNDENDDKDENDDNDESAKLRRRANPCLREISRSERDVFHKTSLSPCSHLAISAPLFSSQNLTRQVFKHASVSRTYPCKLVGPSVSK